MAMIVVITNQLEHRPWGRTANGPGSQSCLVNPKGQHHQDHWEPDRASEMLTRTALALAALTALLLAVRF
jgi:hypothetical protein